MEEDQDLIPLTTGQVAKKWGLYVGLLSIVYFTIQQMAGLGANDAMNWLGSIILIVGVVLAHREFKTEGNGFMSLKQGFSIGAVITLISSFVSVIFSYIYVKAIDDSMMALIKEKQIEQMEGQGMSEAEIDQAMEFTGAFMTPEVIMGIGLFIGIIVGLVISLIIAAITKNEDPSVEI